MENNATFTREALARLHRDDLRCLLKEELAKNSANIDEARVRLILNELELRGKDPTFYEDDNVEAACEKFCKDMVRTRKQRKRWTQSWLLKVASLILVLGILFFALPGAAQANKVQNVLTWWSDRVFQFFTPGNNPTIQEYVYQTDHPGLQDLYDTVVNLGITEPIVPQWVPEGFELVELKTYEMLGDSMICACMIGTEGRVLITINIHSDEVAFMHEKDAHNVSIWELNGNEHYVLSNKNEQIVTWIVGKIECAITTDCPEEDVYRMIKSIYTLEG